MGPIGWVIYRYILFADDVVCAMAHEHGATLQLVVWKTAGDVGRGLPGLGPGFAREKSGNLVISPADAEGGFHRRSPSSFRKGIFQIQKRGDQPAAPQERKQLPMDASGERGWPSPSALRKMSLPPHL